MIIPGRIAKWLGIHKSWSILLRWFGDCVQMCSVTRSNRDAYTWTSFILISIACKTTRNEWNWYWKTVDIFFFFFNSNYGRTHFFLLLHENKNNETTIHRSWIFVNIWIVWCCCRPRFACRFVNLTQFVWHSQIKYFFEIISICQQYNFNKFFKCKQFKEIYLLGIVRTYFFVSYRNQILYEKRRNGRVLQNIVKSLFESFKLYIQFVEWILRYKKEINWISVINFSYWALIKSICEWIRIDNNYSKCSSKHLYLN